MLALAGSAGCNLILDFDLPTGEATDSALQTPDTTPSDAAADATIVYDAPPDTTCSSCVFRSCAAALTLVPESAVVHLDPDEAGPVAPFDVYCNQTLAGGGWQLVSVTPPGGVIPPGSTAPVAFVGPEICLDPAAPCAGHIAPSQVSTAVELAIVDESGAYLVLTQFSGAPGSALRYLSLEQTLTTSADCTAPHVCGSATLDPSLAIATTSGYPMAYAPPLLQWWRLGGWWIGAGVSAGNSAGNVFRTSYGFVNWLSTRATPDGTSTLLAEGQQTIWLRVPALPSTTP